MMCLSRYVMVAGIAAMAGCAGPDRHNQKDHQKAQLTSSPGSVPKASGSSSGLVDQGFYAICNVQTSGGHLGPWVGELRPKAEEALRDASDHNRKYPGHQATIVEY